MLKYIIMACINTNLPEFKELQKQYKSGFKAYSAVTRWQKATNSDMIPTMEQIRDMDSVQEFLLKKDIESFSEQLVGNLLNIDLVENLNGVYVLRGGIESVKQKAKLIKNYLYINNIPQSMVSFARIKNTDDYKLVIDESALTKVDIIPKTRSNNSNKTNAIITHLQNLFPQLKVERRKAREVRELYLNIPEEQRANVDYKDVKSFYDPSTMTSYILTDRVNDETAIEELLHPFIDAVKQDNPELYNNLLSEAKSTFPQLKLKIDKDYSDDRGFDSDVRDIELVTQALTRHFSSQYEKQPSKTFLERVKEFLSWFYDTLVNSLHKIITGKPIKRKEQIEAKIKEKQQSNIVYTGAFVQENILDKYSTDLPNKFAHHMTVSFKPKRIDVPIGAKVDLKVIGRLTTDKVDVLILDNELSTNEYPHITLSTAEGVKPFMSNQEIQNNLDKIIPLNDTVEAVYGYFDGNTDVIKQSSVPTASVPVNVTSNIASTIYELEPNITEAKLKDIHNNYVNLMNRRRMGKAIPFDTFLSLTRVMPVYNYNDTYIFGMYDTNNAVFITKLNSSPSSRQLLTEAIPNISNSGIDVISFVPKDYADRLVRSGYTSSSNSYETNFKGELMQKFAVASNPNVFKKVFNKDQTEITSTDIKDYSESFDLTYKPVEISTELIRKAGNDLSKILETYLNQFGIVVKDINTIKDKLNIDELGFADLLSKIAYIKDKKNLPPVAGEFIAYMMQYNSLVKDIVNTLIQTEAIPLPKGVGEKDMNGKWVYNYNKLDKSEYFKYIGKLIGEDLQNKLEGNYDKSLIQMIKDLIKRFFDYMTKVDIDLINENVGIISSNILQQNKKLITASLYKPGAFGKKTKQVSLKEAMESDKFGNVIIKKLSKEGFILTGSTSLGEQGTIQRPNENLLHDIDWVSPFSREETKDKFLNQYPDAIFVRDIYNENYQTDTWLIAPEGFSIANYKTKTFVANDGSERIIIQSYDVVDKQGNVRGTYRLKQEEGSKKTQEVETGVRGKVIDFFSYDTYDQLAPFEKDGFYLANWKEIFKAKLDFARYKDIWDYNRFVPKENMQEILMQENIDLQDEVTLGVNNISPSASLSDIAKLLNTSDTIFEFNKPTDLKVKYALSSERKKIILGIKRRANASQNIIIDKITEVTKQSKYDVDSFSALKSKDNVVIFDDASKQFVNLNTGETPKSVSEDIFGANFASKTDQLRKDLDGDIDKIIEGAVLGKPLDELGITKIQTTAEQGNRFSEAERLYRYFSNVVRQLDSDSVAVPNVVVYDPVKNIADKIDLVVITRTGQIKLINFHLTTPEGLSNLNQVSATANDSVFAGLFSSMSEKQLLNTRLQVQRRLIEAVVGTKQMSHDNSSMQTYIVSVKIEDGKITEEINTENVLTVESADVDKADEMIEDRYHFVDDVDNSYYDPMQEEIDNFYLQEAVVQKADEMADIETITRGLQNFKKGLITRREALKKIKSSIYVDVSKAEAINDIDLALSQINIALASENQQELNSTYSYFLRNSIREVNRFIEYLQDPKNFGKEEFISYALNAKRFAVTYQGLYSVDNASKLNVNLKALTSDLQAALNSLQGNVMTDEMNVSDLAILDHIKTMVKMTTSQDLTEEELDDVLKYAKDITKAEYLTRDLATSRDVILRVMNKIYHNKKMQVLDSIATYEQMITKASAKLLKLSPTTDRQKLFLFMLNPDGTYIQRIGEKFRKRAKELRDKTYDANGNPLKYIQIDDLSKAKKEDIAFNKKLADDKRALSEFLTAEITDSNNMYADGPNRKYTQAFKDIRDQYEQYDKTTKQWIIKTGVSKEKYEEYRLKYYEEKTYLTVERDLYDQPTGLTKEVTRKFPRPVVNGVKMIEVRETNAAGESYLDPRYQRMLQPQTELEKAQLEFYEVYDTVYNEMLKALPPGVRYQMTGRIPVIANKLLKGTENKKNIVTKFFAKMSRGVQSFFEDTVEQRSVTIDENGELVDSLGVFYVGNLRDEEKLKEIEVSIEVLQNKFRDGEINRDQYDKQIKILKGQRKKLRAKPASGELSLDLGSNLMKFVGMAENFRIMTQAEDTLNAMVKVIEKRSYQLSDDKIILGKLKEGEFEEKAAIKGADSNTLKRAKAFMKMVFYDNERANKGTLDKIVDGVLQYTSLAYVGLNPFGSFNNYAFARISNYIEVLGGSRYFDRKAYLRAEAEFNKYGIPGFLNRMSSAAKNLNGRNFYDPVKPSNKYEALVDFLRMMDTKGELREMTTDFDQKSYFRRAADFAYYLQDAGEYNVQTKVGMAIVMSTYIKNSKTGETLSLYDAFDFDQGTKEVKLKDGFDMVVKKNKTTGEWQDIGAFDDTFRYNLRSNIREVNKQIHGNYARDDRMVIQATTVGKLAAQFHKWVAPAINARFQKEYYDENLGWMEGRYRSWLRYIQTVFAQLSKGNLDVTSYNEEFKKHYGFKGDGSQADQKITNRLQGFYRTTAELTIIGIIFMLKSVLEASFGEDDDDNVSDEIKRFRNFLRYQTDRTYKDMVIFIPIIPSGAEQIYQMFKSPIASTRTMGDMARAISTTINTGFGYTFRENDELFWSDKDYVYQRGIRKGQLKMSKYWNDVIPIFRSIQKYTDFLNMTNYYIK